ncbi:unnamed protein product [Cuscuta campestris]|uniref:RBR-type E3 ubiquitin transferase n=1 Tax=Cuscuta campestris TaxID=132261 RepID=A0A484LZJ1_9ASTE|nr:unnamed protein product [Cuscuta campestris]
MVRSDDALFEADSPKDDFYSGGDSDVSEGSGSDGEAGRDTEFLGDDDLELETNFTILNRDDIRRLMEADMAQIISVLSVSRAEASTLLRRYNWSVNRVHEEWFADEERVRKEVGLEWNKPYESFEFSGSGEITCGICFDDLSPCKIYASSCNHPFCLDCWSSYIGTAVADGPGCLSLRCPDPSCKIAVNLDAIENLATEDDKKKYFCFLFRSYVEENMKIKWCTAPGCEFAIRFEIGSENADVICECGNFFCWNCTEEAHRPVDCETVGKWILKNNAESENTNWILAYTKPCPKCKRPIEKGEGCMRITCKAPCRFQFCWLCLNDWSVHGYNSCNRYKPGSEAERRKEMAKVSIQRYTHYYERWAANEKSMKKAMADLREMEGVNVMKICEHQSLSLAQVKFIVEAWKQIIECRRVLKWTYAYGFYLPQEEHTKSQFFEYLQGQAEEGLERLHQCAEKELEIYLSPEEADSPNFSDFRIKLTGLTAVTKNYFENLVSALENGIEDVDTQAVHYNSKNGCSGSNSNRATVSGCGRDKTGWKNLLAIRGIKTQTERNAIPILPNNVAAMTALENTATAQMKEQRRRIAAGLATPNMVNNGAVAFSRNMIGVEPGQKLNFGNTLQIPMGMGRGLQPGSSVNGVVVGGLDPRLLPRGNLANVLPTWVNGPVAYGYPQGIMGNGPVSGGPANRQTVLGTGNGSNAHHFNALVGARRSYDGVMLGVDKRFRESSESIMTTGKAAKNYALGAGSSNMASVRNSPLTTSGKASAFRNPDLLLPGGSSSSRSVAIEKRRRTSRPPTTDMPNISNSSNGDLGSWACDMCTFLNPSSANVCTMCADDASGNWECDKCTFVNKNRRATTCQICEQPR